MRAVQPIQQMRVGLGFWLWLSTVVMAVDSVAFLWWPFQSANGAYGFALGLMGPRAWGVFWLVGAILGAVSLLRPMEGPLRLLLLGQFLSYSLFGISVLKVTLENDQVSALAGVSKWGALAVAAAWSLTQPFTEIPRSD